MALYTFTALRFILSFAGIVTLVITILPGLFSFADNIDPNLGMGGIALFFLWPVVALHIALGLALSKKYTEKHPFLAWLLLFFAFFIFIPIDITTIQLVYT